MIDQLGLQNVGLVVGQFPIVSSQLIRRKDSSAIVLILTVVAIAPSLGPAALFSEDRFGEEVDVWKVSTATPVERILGSLPIVEEGRCRGQLGASAGYLELHLVLAACPGFDHALELRRRARLLVDVPRTDEKVR